MIDLHTHSRCSDGSNTPAEVVELAAAAGCSTVALTDHDGLAGLDEADAAANRLGVGFIRGCEVSANISAGSVHVLCYFVDEQTPLAEKLATLRSDRVHRNNQLFDRLASLGIELDPEEVEAAAGSKVVGRPHFAQVLADHGYAESINDAFLRFLGAGAPAYVPREHVDVEEIIDLAQASGALAVLAHPLTIELGPRELEAQIAVFAERGLTGLESYYSTYDEDQRSELVTIARRYGLVPTGGSDYHGTFKPGLFVGTGRGDLSVPDDVAIELRDRLER